MPAFVGNTNVLLLSGLHSEIDGSYINDATVSVTVKDKDGVELAGVTWPADMTYVTASNGNYRIFLVDDAALSASVQYVAFISADGGASKIGNWQFNFTARERIV
jgi:hypothetical protein